MLFSVCSFVQSKFKKGKGKRYGHMGWTLYQVAEIQYTGTVKEKRKAHHQQKKHHHESRGLLLNN